MGRFVNSSLAEYQSQLTRHSKIEAFSSRARRKVNPLVCARESARLATSGVAAAVPMPPIMRRASASAVADHAG